MSDSDMQWALEIIHASNEWSGTPPPVRYREHLQRGIAAALAKARSQPFSAWANYRPDDLTDDELAEYERIRDDGS